jgi:hypothetical protein
MVTFETEIITLILSCLHRGKTAWTGSARQVTGMEFTENSPFYCCRPPERRITCPVTHLASSEGEGFLKIRVLRAS